MDGNTDSLNPDKGGKYKESKRAGAYYLNPTYGAHQTETSVHENSSDDPPYEQLGQTGKQTQPIYDNIKRPSYEEQPTSPSGRGAMKQRGRGRLIAIAVGVALLLAAIGLALTLIGVFVIAPQGTYDAKADTARLKDNETHAAIDGQWSAWTVWTTCTKTCDSGVQTRQRTCSDPAPQNGGLNCSGSSLESRPCSNGNCSPGSAIDGQWSPWSGWTTCSETCGVGVQTRQRTCSDPAPQNGGLNCAGSSLASRPCSNGACAPGSVNGNWSAWSSWSECSSACGDGVQTRQRKCDHPAPQHGGLNCSGPSNETKSCYVRPCQVGWSQWSECSSTCGTGVQTRQRNCDQHGGLNCSGPNNETKLCYDRPCQEIIDGRWSRWDPWSTCTKSCDSGEQYRRRSCTAPSPQNGGLDCVGPASESRTCANWACTGQLRPIDGQWSRWDPWSPCSKTCGGGEETRQRACTDPEPQNGGLNCSGPSSESRACADWSCPDCTKTCPNGGRLIDCSTCVCTDSTLHGKVTDMRGLPVGDVSVFHEDKQWQSIAKTNQYGRFFVQGICANGTVSVFRQSEFNDNQGIALGQNDTHAFVNVTLVRKKPPEITLHPEDKARFVGQSVTLCCNATGDPAPHNYLWLKDNRILPEEHQSNGSFFTIGNLLVSDEGTYQCQAISMSGKSLSKGGHLSVNELDVEMCSKHLKTSPLQLPEGCFYQNKVTGVQENTVDVGGCEPQTCIRPANVTVEGACSDHVVTSFCCQSNATESLTITCSDGTTYEVYKTTSCACADCEKENIVAFVRGIIYGLSGTTVVPLRYGIISFKGERLASTDDKGKFIFRVPANTDILSVKIEDLYFRDLLSTVKIMRYQPGRVVSQSIRIPLKPAPVLFNSSESQELTVNGSGSEPIGTIKIGKQSLIDKDGNPHEGEAQLVLAFQDLRDADALTTTPGEFVSTNDEGEREPLRTFGTFSVNVEASNRDPLYFSNPPELLLDPEKVSVTMGSDGQPDVSLWRLNDETGSWVDVGPLTMGETTSGNFTSRKLLSRFFIVAKLPASVELDKYNLDKQEQRTILCYVKIRAYTDTTMSDGLPGVTAYILTKNGSSWVGYYQRTTGQDGVACLQTYCPDATGFIFLENLGVNGQPQKLLANFSDNPNVIIINDTDVEYSSPLVSSNTPFYPSSGKDSCGSSSLNSTHIKFYPPPQLCHVNKKNESHWKVKTNLMEETSLFQACFIKVNITSVYGHFGYESWPYYWGWHTHTIQSKMQIFVYSGFPDGESLGTAFCSSRHHQTEHVACLQIRCPGISVSRNGKPVDKDTNVTVRIAASSTSHQQLVCRHTWTNRYLQIDRIVEPSPLENRLSFTAIHPESFGYGKDTGIILTERVFYDTAVEDAREACLNEGKPAVGFECRPP